MGCTAIVATVMADMDEKKREILRQANVDEWFINMLDERDEQIAELNRLKTLSTSPIITQTQKTAPARKIAIVAEGLMVTMALVFLALPESWYKFEFGIVAAPLTIVLSVVAMCASCRMIRY